MFPIGELTLMVLKSAVVSMTEPSFLLIFGAVLFLVYTQYRRMAAAELQMYGTIINPPGAQLLNAIWAGLAGGVVGTVLFVFPGIALPGPGIYYIWIIALLLALIHPRFICFAYGGGLVALSSLLFGEPQINVGASMALVAILHLVEAVLIRLQGARNVTPVYTRRSDGRVVGGFLLQKFWPLPFVALLGVIVAGELPEGAGLAMPNWWPLIGAPDASRPGTFVVLHAAAGCRCARLRRHRPDVLSPGKGAPHVTTPAHLQFVPALFGGAGEYAFFVGACCGAFFTTRSRAGDLSGRYQEEKGEPVELLKKAP